MLLDAAHVRGTDDEREIHGDGLHVGDTSLPTATIWNPTLREKYVHYTSNDKSWRPKFGTLTFSTVLDHIKLNAGNPTHASVCSRCRYDA